MIEVIDDMLPVIEIDTSPLLEEASRLEEQIQQALEMMQKGLAHGQEEPRPMAPSPMYR
jgi:predicted ATP-grasp superfamily ATP-dependent carboligase